MSETQVILKEAVSYHLIDSFLLGLTWTVLAVIGARTLWRRQRYAFGVLVSVVVVIVAVGTVNVAIRLYRDVRPERTIATFADDQVSILRPGDETAMTIRQGEVNYIYIGPSSPGRTEIIGLALTDGTVNLIFASVTQSRGLVKALADHFGLEQRDPNNLIWLPSVTGN